MTPHYTPVAKTLHWLMAVLLFGLLALGFTMTDLPLSPRKLQLYSWHKWAGVTVFLLVLFAWPGARPIGRPPLPDHLPKMMRFAAHAGHALLYRLMIVIPLSGWLMSSAKGFQTVWFGVLPIPDLVDKNQELGDLLQTVHLSLNLLFVAVIVGHIGAALKHHFIDRDDVLTRMLPARSTEK